MGIDILEKEEIITYRETDIDLLMSIRNGDYMLEDNTVSPKFYDMIKDLEKRFKLAEANTKLPEKPNFKEVEKWLMGVNKHYIGFDDSEACERMLKALMGDK